MNKIFISCKESIIENNRCFYGSFSIGPFTETQSLTIGNALRRTLLSECSGLAIISVLIEDVTHEYSTLPGVRDSVLDILLNLKEIVFKKTTNPWFFYKQKGISSVYNSIGASFFKPMVAYLKVKGPGIVRAKDLRLPPFIQLVDPDQYIATLSENGVLNMKVIIMEGKNYIIQKNTEFIDYSFIKKRRTLFNNLKELLNKSSVASKPNLKKTMDLKTALNVEQFTPSKTKQIKHNDDMNYQFFHSFKNAAPLNIDAVFNPIKKVNYIIEVNDNKMVDHSNEKYTFIDEISKFMESSDLYKRNFPFLSETYSSLLPETKLNPTKSNLDKNILKNKQFLTELIDYIEEYSKEELWTYSRSLHPLRKEGLLHTVMLEIWTNGSIHPREALSLAFSKLTNLFLNFEKTKIFYPMYKDISSYKKCLNNLSTNSNINLILSDTQKNSGNQKSLMTNSSLSRSEDTNYSLTEQSSGSETTEKLDISILNLNLRAYTNFKRANINTIKDLLDFIPSVTKDKLLNDFNIDGPTVEILLKLLK